MQSATWMPDQEWKPARSNRKHDCETCLPSKPQGDEGDLFVCPQCRRRWRLVSKTGPDGIHDPCRISEGVQLRGPDGSSYWRPYRCRFLGRLGA